MNSQQSNKSQSQSDKSESVTENTNITQTESTTSTTSTTNTTSTVDTSKTVENTEIQSTNSSIKGNKSKTKSKYTPGRADAISIVNIATIIYLIIALIINLKNTVEPDDTVVMLASMLYLSIAIALILIQAILLVVVINLEDKLGVKTTLTLLIVDSAATEFVIQLYLNTYFSIETIILTTTVFIGTMFIICLHTKLNDTEIKEKDFDNKVKSN